MAASQPSRFPILAAILLYVASLLLPGVGLIVGLVYIMRNDLATIKVGRVCLLLGLAWLFICCCLAGPIFCAGGVGRGLLAPPAYTPGPSAWLPGV